MDESILKLLYRIKNSDDGKDFIDYLVSLSTLNYKAWKSEGGDLLRGKAIMVDSLLEAFETCSDKLVVRSEPTEWL